MNPRLAAVLLLGFVASLAFLAWWIAGRRKGQRERLERLIYRNQRLEELVSGIRTIAIDNQYVDPSIDLILMNIQKHDTDYSKEIA